MTEVSPGRQNGYVLHPRTEVAVGEYIGRPALPLLITGPPGSGKATLAACMAQQVVAGEAAPDHPYIYTVRPEDGRSIPIAAVRHLQQLLTLAVPHKQGASLIRRAAVIEDGHLLTIEAQNALLKTLEEPPADTAIFLTATSSDAVLPTVQSRVQELGVLPPPAGRLREHFTGRGYGSDAIGQALMLSGGLPGLASALLEADTAHPLVAATLHARGILQSKTYDRLLLVDSLSKQKELCVNILFILMQMSRMALQKASGADAVSRWRKVMAASYQASEELRHNSQTKLVLTNLMLAL